MKFGVSENLDNYNSLKMLMLVNRVHLLELVWWQVGDEYES